MKVSNGMNGKLPGSTHAFHRYYTDADVEYFGWPRSWRSLACPPTRSPRPWVSPPTGLTAILKGQRGVTADRWLGRRR